MSILFYKKPEYSTGEGPLSKNSCQKYVERTACSRAAVPDELSFKNVIEDRALPPCSLQDFLDYLIYVSHDAENLQFYLWYKDYCRRFNSVPGWKRDLSPLWTEVANQTRTHARPFTQKKTAKKAPPRLDVPKTFASSGDYPSPSLQPKVTKKALPLTPSPAQQFKEFSFHSPHSPLLSSPLISNASSETLPLAADIADKLHISADDNGSELDVDEKTRSTQPFRAEVERITSHYLRVGAPRELNLSSKERECVLRAVEQTTHPTAFLEVASLVETTLRYHSHRNFVRWSICNGNKPRVLVLRSLAIFVLSCTIALAFILILSSYSRWLRLSVIPLCFFASVNLIAARQGLCVLLHRQKTREARPWEIGDAELDLEYGGGITGFSPRANTSIEGNVGSSLDSQSEKRSFFGPKNEYRHESWVKRWESRSPWQKIRVQKVRIGKGGLRNVQDRIIWQAEAWGALVTFFFTASVCAFPQVGLF